MALLKQTEPEVDTGKFVVKSWDKIDNRYTPDAVSADPLRDNSTVDFQSTDARVVIEYLENILNGVMGITAGKYATYAALVSATKVEGAMYYCTENKLYYGYDGTSLKVLG